MAPKKSLLDQMRDNPSGDWQIADVATLCEQVGMTLEEPTSGSHFKVYSALLQGPLTIPARRPIKPPYIRLLVVKAKAHLARSNERSG